MFLVLVVVLGVVFGGAVARGDEFLFEALGVLFGEFAGLFDFDVEVGFAGEYFGDEGLFPLLEGFLEVIELG